MNVCAGREADGLGHAHDLSVESDHNDRELASAEVPRRPINNLLRKLRVFELQTLLVEYKKCDALFSCLNLLLLFCLLLLKASADKEQRYQYGGENNNNYP